MQEVIDNLNTNCKLDLFKYHIQLVFKGVVYCPKDKMDNY